MLAPDKQFELRVQAADFDIRNSADELDCSNAFLGLTASRVVREIDGAKWRSYHRPTGRRLATSPLIENQTWPPNRCRRLLTPQYERTRA